MQCSGEDPDERLGCVNANDDEARKVPDGHIDWLRQQFRGSPYASMREFDAEHYDELCLPK